MFYHIYHRTVPFRSFPFRLFLSPSSPVPPSLINAPPVPSDRVLLSYIVFLFAVPSSFSIETPSQPVLSLFFLCRLFPICHVHTRLFPCHPVPSSSGLSLLVPSRSVLQYPVPSLPGLPGLSFPVPSHPASFRAGLSCSNPFTPTMSPLFH